MLFSFPRQLLVVWTAHSSLDSFTQLGIDSSNFYARFPSFSRETTLLVSASGRLRERHPLSLHLRARYFSKKKKLFANFFRNLLDFLEIVLKFRRNFWKFHGNPWNLQISIYFRGCRTKPVRNAGPPGCPPPTWRWGFGGRKRTLPRCVGGEGKNVKPKEAKKAWVPTAASTQDYR